MQAAAAFSIESVSWWTEKVVQRKCQNKEKRCWKRRLAMLEQMDKFFSSCSHNETPALSSSSVSILSTRDLSCSAGGWCFLSTERPSPGIRLSTRRFFPRNHKHHRSSAAQYSADQRRSLTEPVPGFRLIELCTFSGFSDASQLNYLKTLCICMLYSLCSGWWTVRVVF